MLLTAQTCPYCVSPVISVNGIPHGVKQELPLQSLQMLDYWYARDYEPANDLKIIWKAYRRLGG